MSLPAQKEQNSKWQLNWGIILQTLVILIGGAFGWARLEYSTSELKARMQQHIEQNERQFQDYVRRDVWQTRNGFVDGTLVDLRQGQKEINEKLDKILEQIRKAR